MTENGFDEFSERFLRGAVDYRYAQWSLCIILVFVAYSAITVAVALDRHTRSTDKQNELLRDAMKVIKENNAKR